jgi:PAS domain S-box-containing protein
MRAACLARQEIRDVMTRKSEDDPATCMSRGNEATSDVTGARHGHSRGDMQRVLDELHSHQVELQMQNEALQSARLQLEASLSRYTELYDNAPIGYVSLDQRGRILQANLTAAVLLGSSRESLVGCDIAGFVDPVCASALGDFLVRAFSSWHTEKFELVIRSGKGANRVVRLKSNLDASGAECRVVLMDVTALRRTELRFNQLAQNIDQVFWVSDQAIGEFAYLSTHCDAVLGMDCRMFVRSADMRRTHIHAEDLERHEAAFERARWGEPSEVEYRVHHPAKGLRWLRVRSFPFEENGKHMNAGLLEDVTERKDAEQARLSESLRLRDALTSEVHHRIKNNLQTVVGLLRREAGKHPEAAEAIEAAIGQVQSVALVHGLYGQGMKRSIMLCELLPAVVGNVSELSGTPIVREAGHETCGQLLIKESETVAVALIINELVTNAVKHSSVGAGDAGQRPLVQLTRVGSQGRIRIANPGRLAPDFDFDLGSGLGTGLGLVRALMPVPGMSIRFSQSGAHVFVELIIEPPVLGVAPSAQFRCKGQLYEKCADRR